jgi:capsular polysaccharide biosynthesis protein
LSPAHESYSQRTVTAGDVYRALWRHKFFIVVLTAVFVGAAWYATSRQARRYEASTLVRVQERGDTGNQSLVAAQTLTQTYAEIIGSGALKGPIETFVAGCASGKPSSLKGFLPPVRLRRARTSNLQGSLPGLQGSLPGTSLSARKAAAARRFRRAYAQACRSIAVTSRARVAPRKVARVRLSGSPVQGLDLLSISAGSKTPANATIAANAAPWALRAFIRRTGSGTEKVVLVKAATKPTSPVSQQLPLKIAIAVMFGLIFNGALALLLELFRDRLPEPDELGQALGRPVLATIPNLRLHEAATLAAARQGPTSVPTEQSRDGEGSTRTTGPRAGPGP